MIKVLKGGCSNNNCEFQHPRTSKRKELGPRSKSFSKKRIAGKWSNYTNLKKNSQNILFQLWQKSQLPPRRSWGLGLRLSLRLWTWWGGRSGLWPRGSSRHWRTGRIITSSFRKKLEENASNLDKMDLLDLAIKADDQLVYRSHRAKLRFFMSEEVGQKDEGGVQKQVQSWE